MGDANAGTYIKVYLLISQKKRSRIERNFPVYYSLGDRTNFADKKMEPFHQVFKKQVIIMDQFAKILRFFLKEVSAVSEGRIDLESNELVRRFFAAIFDEMKNLSQLSSKVSQMAMYRKHADSELSCLASFFSFF